MRKVMVLALCLSLAASFSLAREATLTRVDMDIMGEMMRDDVDCVVGNADYSDILGYYGSWYWGFEDYAYRVTGLHSFPTGCFCNQGWALRNITFLLALDVGANDAVQYQVALHAGDPSAPACMPGAEIYASQPYTVTGITQLAYYTVTAPFDPMACQVPASGNYYLVFKFLNAGPVFGIPITAPEGSGVTCRNFNDWGGGWVDLVADYGWVGDMYISAEVDCCWDGVQAEESSLSDIKQLFR